MGGMFNKIFITLILSVSIGCSVIFGIYGSVLFQEGNPLPLVASIVKLKLTDTEYVQFAKTEKQSRYLSTNKGKNQLKVVKEFMKAKGWNFTEQMGAGLIFYKDEKEAIVLTRQFSRHFVIWDISKSITYSDSDTWEEQMKTPNLIN
jgi:hypothetical protein